MELFKDSSSLLIVIGVSLVACVIMAIMCVCACSKKHKSARYKKEKHTEMESLLFVYDTNIEKQQPPLSMYPFGASDNELYLPSGGMKRSLSNIDVTLPFYSNESLTRASSTSAMDPTTLDLSQYKGEESQPCSPYTGLGKLSLSLIYKSYDEKLILKVLKGVQIHAKQSTSVPCPYLKISLLPDKKSRMHSKTKKGENPSFNESFSFSLPSCELATRVLKLSVCDFDRFSRQNILGYVVLPLNEVIRDLLKDRGTGVIWKDILETDTLPGLNKGELLFSLSHLPTAGRLTITVDRGKSLFIDETRDLGVAVKVNLILNGKVVKSKKTCVNKSCLSNPSFNESFVFEAYSLDRASFAMAVHAYTNSGKRLIGKTNTGPYMYSTGTGLTHWNEMLAQLRTAIFKWHDLV